MTKLAISITLVLLGCAKSIPSSESGGGAKIRKVEALGALMKNEINPAFSKVVFLLAHGDSMPEDPRAVRGELEVAGNNLQRAIGKLRLWHNPPTESDQGRDVFLTYAGSLDGMTSKLMQAIGANDRQAALGQLEKIADTCNNCHHFFRLEIEDSVVTRTAAASSAMAALRF
jgi:hypothetical protein